jgi:mannose-6-phosphate isomerase-like protein (cupin superfamily)
MGAVPSFFGSFPFPPDRKRPAVVTKASMKTFVYPLESLQHSDLNWVIASTDKVFSAIYKIPPGGRFEPPDIHEGDEPYYILEGTLTMRNPDTDQTVEIRQGEALYIPKGAWHQGYNFTDEDLKILVMIAPQIWGAQGPPPSGTK